MGKLEGVTEMHKASIWYSKESGFWFTYLPVRCGTKPRKMIKRRNKDDIISTVNDFYFSKEENESKKSNKLKYNRKNVVEYAKYSESNLAEFNEMKRKLTIYFNTKMRGLITKNEPFYHTQDRIADKLGISRNTVISAINTLSSEQYISVIRRGNPCRNFCKINFDYIQEQHNPDFDSTIKEPRIENVSAYVDAEVPQEKQKEDNEAENYINTFFSYKNMRDAKKIMPDVGRCYSEDFEDSINAHIRSMEYKDFLRTPYWSYVKNQVRKRENGICQLCCKKKCKMNVHHLTYEHHGKEISHLEDLQLLCEHCHKIIHGKTTHLTKEDRERLNQSM